MVQRLKGNKLALEIDGEDYWAEITSYLLTREDSDDDVVTFKDASEGETQDEKLQITAVQSTDSASFWRTVWDNVGEEVTFKIAPNGNETPSENQPHITGTVEIPRRPDLGGEAGRNNTHTFEVEFDVVGQSILDTGE